jgi:hypothetical protein
MFENAHLLSILANYGDIVKTKYRIDTKKANEIIKKYDEHWKVYNPRDIDNRRYGLSLTSLDGGFSGVPDLDSLSQYLKETGIEYLEKDFNTETPLLNELKETTDLFNNYDLGRSHIIRLDKGGHFPTHRDLDDTFRLICWLDCDPPDNMVFLLEDNSINFHRGVVYFVNTIKYHNLFSFINNNKIIVLNVNLDKKNVHQLIRDRFYR